MATLNETRARWAFELAAERRGFLAEQDMTRGKIRSLARQDQNKTERDIVRLANTIIFTLENRT